ncbi:MAG: tetratricopeptide repeat protein [Candidatus Omnitrophota bacterium]|nr:tetratricopeptide repeat protein [Candidatus Omnitrophota bacterium]MBU2528930.1 tetratricopeptide repeat protein [bacterium]MBU3929911.1 tetratricopeptide repeat protein [bacterium]MBU4122885.1 tetratricopeptide repeat protein [bacterium]
MRIGCISAAVFLASVSLCPAADDIGALYNSAVKNFSAGKYSDAIRCWQRILEIDPEQVPPHKMIEFTRGKIKQELAPRVQAFEKNMQAGKWFIAHDAACRVLDIDPAYPGLAEKKDKLGEIAGITEDCSGSGKVPIMLRKSVHAYFDKNPALMFDAAIYAEQLNKDIALGRKISALLSYMEKKYPEARSRVKLIAGMDLMKQLLQSSLDSIYKADYTGAIMFCDRILALDESSTLALMRKGSAYYALNNFNEARKNWQLALKTDPGNKDVKKFLNLLDRKKKKTGGKK